MKRKFLLTTETFYTDESHITDTTTESVRIYGFDNLKKYLNDEIKKIMDEYNVVFNDVEIKELNRDHIVVNIEGRCDYYEYSVHFKWIGD